MKINFHCGNETFDRLQNCSRKKGNPKRKTVVLSNNIKNRELKVADFPPSLSFIHFSAELHTHNCLACFIIESVRSPKLKSLQLSQSIYLFILSLSHTRRRWDFQVLNLDASPKWECVWRGWNEWWELRFNNVEVYVLDGGGRGGGGILGGNYATFNEDSVI